MGSLPTPIDLICINFFCVPQDWGENEGGEELDLLVLAPGQVEEVGDEGAHVAFGAQHLNVLHEGLQQLQQLCGPERIRLYKLKSTYIYLKCI